MSELCQTCSLVFRHLLRTFLPQNQSLFSVLSSPPISRSSSQSKSSPATIWRFAACDSFIEWYTVGKWRLAKARWWLHGFWCVLAFLQDGVSVRLSAGSFVRSVPNVHFKNVKFLEVRIFSLFLTGEYLEYETRPLPEGQCRENYTRKSLVSIWFLTAFSHVFLLDKICHGCYKIQLHSFHPSVD